MHVHGLRPFKDQRACNPRHALLRSLRTPLSSSLQAFEPRIDRNPQRALPSRVRALYQRWALPPRIRCPATTARAWPTRYGRTTRVRIQSYANRSAYGVVVAQPLGLHGLLLRLGGHLPRLRRSPAACLPLRLPSQTRKAAYRTPLLTRTLVPSRLASRIPSPAPSFWDPSALSLYLLYRSGNTALQGHSPRICTTPLSMVLPAL